MKFLYFYNDSMLHLGVAIENGVMDVTVAQGLKGGKANDIVMVYIKRICLTTNKIQ